MAQKIKKLSKKFIALVCMITLVFTASATVNKADATLESVKDTLTDSRFNTASDHTIVFTVKAAALTDGDTIVVTFEEDFTTTSMAFADISVDDGAAVTLEDTTCTTDNDTVRVTGYGTNTVTFFLCATTTIADEATVTITFGNLHITNPATAVCGDNDDSYICDIGITTSDETGTAEVAIVSGVTVSATVSEALTFEISQTAVGFGTINSGTLRYANTAGTGAVSAPGAGDPFTLTYDSNVAGASVTVKSINAATTAGLYSSSVTQTLTARAANAMAADTNGFAIYGVDTSGDLSVVAGFLVGGGTAVTTGNQTFASGSSVGTNVIDVDLIASAAVGTLGAADYATTLVFVATPVY